ncbi:transmembrane protein [Pelomyxa schiedti]|nr:transmembrane protein [Pelomyxa schiedti]
MTRSLLVVVALVAVFSVSLAEPNSKPSVKSEFEATREAGLRGVSVDQSSLADYVVPKLPAVWDIIGPFPLGERELAADPLEAWGGIDNIPRADSTKYPSEIADMGLVGWSKVNTSESGTVTADWTTLNHWDVMYDSTGSTSEYFQAWALGDIEITADSGGIVMAYCSGVSLYYIDDLPCAGDIYGEGYPWVVADLGIGTHTMKVWFKGGKSGSLTYGSFSCGLKVVAPNSTLAFQGNTITPSIVNGTLATPWLRIGVQNLDLKKSISSFELELINAPNGLSIKSYDSNLNLEPRQLGWMRVALQQDNTFIQCNTSVPITINFVGHASTTVYLTCVGWATTWYIATFLDADDSVQYYTVYPPRSECPSKGCPILVGMHGAGVEATSWAPYYPHNPIYWEIMCTNRHMYGFDWQGPGFANVFASIKSLVNSTYPCLSCSPNLKANPEWILWSGHSMGGHGCWLMSTHFPDVALGAMCVSGWLTFDLYTPFPLRVGYSFASPFAEYLLNAAASEYDTELYSYQLLGVSVLGRIGTLDDNVPPYHPRRMSRLVDSLSKNLNAMEFDELPNCGHWWDGVVNDPIAVDFIENATVWMTTQRPTPSHFRVITTNPYSSGGKSTIRILQVRLFSREAYIDVDTTGNKWVLKTVNVQRFGFVVHDIVPLPTGPILLDGAEFDVLVLPKHYCWSNQMWTVCDSDDWEWNERSTLLTGPLARILEGPVMLVAGTTGSEEMSRTIYESAVGFANDLFFLGFSIPVTLDTTMSKDLDKLGSNNILILGGPDCNSIAKLANSSMPVLFTTPGGALTFTIGPQSFSGTGVGVAFVFPNPFSDPTKHTTPRIAVVVAGYDAQGFIRALKQVPRRSGSSAPDYVAIGGDTWGWGGAGGWQASGYWTNTWEFSPETSSFGTLGYPAVPSTSSSSSGSDVGVNIKGIVAVVILAVFVILILCLIVVIIKQQRRLKKLEYKGVN